MAWEMPILRRMEYLNEEIRETTKSGVVKPEKRMSSSYSKPLRINEVSTDDEQRYFTGSKRA